MKTERELLQILQAEERNAVGYYDGEIADEQDKALDYYNGEPFGDEREGFSKVVSQDVAEVVDGRMPDLMRLFASGDTIAEFDPEGPEDEEFAKQATDYCDFIFRKDNAGFSFLHDWFKDAGLSKRGLAKIWWDDSDIKHGEETLVNLSTMDVAELMDDPDVEITGQDVQTDVTFPDGVSYTLSIRKVARKGKICFVGIPAEEFLISRRARDIPSAPYKAHRTRKTLSDLISMGFEKKKVLQLPESHDDEIDERLRDRFDDEEDVDRSGVSIDPMMREVWLLEEYVRTDWDGDNYAELRMVQRVGSVIFENVEVHDDPFLDLCPYPSPHKFYGQSDADKTMDLQRIKSTLWRQTLDNLYLTNNPQKELPEAAERTDGTTLDALLAPEIGGVVPTKMGGQMREITTPFAAGHSFQMLEYIDSVREQRTGVTRYNQGLDADTLNKTARGIDRIMTKSEGRTELIARIYAETGVKMFFRKMLRLLVKYQDRPRTIRLRNEWVDMDPRYWNADMDVTVKVGLGTGNKDQNLVHLENIFQKQALMIQSGQVPQLGYQHVFETVAKMVENMGMKNPERYFPAPETVQPPEPQPDPEMIKAQQDVQIEQFKAKSSMQLQQDKAQLDAAIQQEKAEREAQLAEQRAIFEARLAEQKQQFEQNLAVMQFEFQKQLQASNAAVNAEVKMSKNRPGGDLDK